MPPKPKRRGRPPLDPDGTSTRVQITMPAKTYDVLFQQAQAQAITVPETIRQHLRDRLNDTK